MKWRHDIGITNMDGTSQTISLTTTTIAQGALVQMTPAMALRWMGHGDDVTDVVALQTCSLASYIRGQHTIVDGGCGSR